MPKIGVIFFSARVQTPILEQSIAKMKQLERVKEYFSFTRKERISLLVLILLMSAAWFLPPVLQRSAQTTALPGDTAWFNQARQLLVFGTEADSSGGKDGYNSRPDYRDYSFDQSYSPGKSKFRGELFLFDPNTIDAAGWEMLGLREKTIQTILNYRNKGGHFYKPEDLKRVYGLFEDEYERLVPYVRIEKTADPATAEMRPERQESMKPYNSRYSPLSVDINTADTTAWVALPGIGSKLASRIVGFREKLGGFFSIQQVAETYGLADSVFQQLKPLLKLNTVQLRQLNINTAAKEELKQHPYLRWAIANAIVEYRNQHGLFSSPEDLRKISLINDELYQKLKAYITL